MLLLSPDTAYYKGKVRDVYTKGDFIFIIVYFLPYRFHTIRAFINKLFFD